ncbi:MAG: LytTR family DNA-binding domain-containing protein [Bacteroidales bacterium]|nr:LytTR family DNA-binding domain-containing protein [Bacteroidales bacterium]
MKLKIIIIDDEINAINVLCKIIQVNNVDHEIIATTTDPIEGINLILTHKPDVVFLDIEMPKLSGFQVLASIPDIDFEVIFATAFENYAIKAIKENALDYILKPPTIPEVLNALEKVKEKKLNKIDGSLNYQKLLDGLNSSRFQRIKIPTSNGFELIETENLMYLCADGVYTIAHFRNLEQMVISKPIKQIEELLNMDHFFRVHRSYIINGVYIRRFGRDSYMLEMVDGKEIPVSRRRYCDFITFLSNLEN